MSLKLERVITIFEREEDDKYQGKIVINQIPLNVLQDQFGISSDNPMYDCYEIGEKQRKFFKEKYGIELDLDRYIYYVECYSVDE